MSETDRQRVLSECLEDFHGRKSRGERPDPAEYRERAGEMWDEFAGIVRTEAEIDQAMAPPSTAADLPRAFGEYTLLRELGRGAMGIVFEAVHRTLGRKVAVKVLRTGFDTDEVARLRFRREARSAAQIRHDHIVSIHDAGEIDGQAYYSMAIVDGRSLSELAAAGALPAPKDLARGIAGVADALAQLHAVGIVHRDVKPSNIMMDNSGRMLLTDFGLARTGVDRLTATGQALGTPLYMSPEQVLGRTSEVDGRSDVYGLGATLYELLTGKPIFQADQAVAILRMILKERPIPPSTVRPGIEREFENIVLKATEKRPEDRYATALEMKQDLLAYADGGVVVGRPVSSVRLNARRAVRWWPAAAAAALVTASVTWWSVTRPANVRIQSYPTADVIVNGEPRGVSPLDLALSPGRHQLLLRREGFRDVSRALEVAAGADVSLEPVLAPADPHDAVALAELARGFDVRMQTFAAPGTTRSSGVGTVLPVFPRGTVTAADAATFEIEIGPDVAEQVVVEFRAGGREIHRAVLTPASVGLHDAPLPATVTAALAAGDEVEWGVWDAAAPVTTKFRLAKDDASGRLAQVHCVAEQCELTERQLRAQILLDAGLDLSAYREAAGVARDMPSCERSWAVMSEALTRLGLTESSHFGKVCEGLAAVPADRRGRAIR